MNGLMSVCVCVSGRRRRDQRLGGEDAEHEQGRELQQGARHLHRGEGGGLLPVLPGESTCYASGDGLESHDR